jgi:hypothetical protein
MKYDEGKHNSAEGKNNEYTTSKGQMTRHEEEGIEFNEFGEYTEFDQDYVDDFDDFDGIDDIKKKVYLYQEVFGNHFNNIISSIVNPKLVLFII